MRRIASVWMLIGLGMVWFISGCAPALVASGAAAGYYVSQDERTAKQIVDDASITAAVKAKYLKDPKVPAVNINVDTRNGVVTLRGKLRSREVEDQAILLASQANGVRKIVSRIVIDQTK